MASDDKTTYTANHANAENPPPPSTGSQQQQQHRSSSRRRHRDHSHDYYKYVDSGSSRDRYRRPRHHRRRSNSRDHRHHRHRDHDHHSRSKRSRHQTKSPSPEVDESERDQRTVFAMQLSSRIRHRDLIEFFSTTGRVRDAHIVSERGGSGRSRGVAYIEFYTVDSAVKAVGLSGQRLLDVPIIVQPSDAQRNRQSMTAKQYDADGTRIGGEKGTGLVVVKELKVNMESDDLREFFVLFGPVEYCRVESLEDRWMGVVQLASTMAARRAVDKLNGLELFGTRLRIRLARKPEQEREQQLVRVLWLRNMFNPKEEESSNPNWKEDLENDVSGECANFGEIVKVRAADNDGKNGHVYVEFKSLSVAQQALSGLDGRWFNGRKIDATLVTPFPA